MSPSSSKAAAEQLVELALGSLDQPEQWTHWVREIGDYGSFVAGFKFAGMPAVSVIVDPELNATVLLGQSGEEDFLNISPSDFFDRTLLPLLRTLAAGQVEEREEKRGIGRLATFRFHIDPPHGFKTSYSARVLY